ncbi:MAG: peptidoglycan editing factor PgeF [Blastocatellia bacterium]|nr:MAG: peptidoglycan editing factor PgeF [Blastocatellia bacterium]
MILPVPAPGFEWTSSHGTPALVCRPFEDAAAHVFSTRAWPLGSRLSSPEYDDWTSIAAALGVTTTHLLRVHQVHGANVVVHRAESSTTGATDADVIITDDASVALAIQTADCVPLLIADLRSGAVAAAHAGWRGLALAVPSVTVSALVGEFDSHPTDMVAVIGPSIGPCCYEVGADVRDRFGAAGFPKDHLRRWFVTERRESVVNPPLAGTGARPGHWFLDMWEATRDQLVAVGVSDDRIHTAALCTASHREAFCSYRRDGNRAGRLAAAIRSR